MQCAVRLPFKRSLKRHPQRLLELFRLLFAIADPNTACFSRTIDEEFGQLLLPANSPELTIVLTQIALTGLTWCVSSCFLARMCRFLFHITSN